MYLNAIILLTVVAVMLALWSPRLHGRPTWRAMTTPLASIIGSGFLVLGPILNFAYGVNAPLVMLALCLGAYLFGAAIRYNMSMLQAEAGRHGSRLETLLETTASASLGFAYIVSVAYYLNLFGAFGVSLTEANQPTDARLLTSAVYVLILMVGWTRGFRALEKMEYASVALKLAIIAGLLVGLGIYFIQHVSAHDMILRAPSVSGWHAIALAFGLIVTVQGFETSRYLGRDYDTSTLIRSMKLAQWISTGIYMSYILLISYTFDIDGQPLTETAIIGMMAAVAPILSVLLVAAGLAAQFSAAVADTSGSGGLLTELTRGRLTPRRSYALLVAVGLVLTWSADVFHIISYASRAFALYYMLQAALAAAKAWRDANSPWRAAGFAALALLGLAIVVLGAPVET
ncbi:hypothetical protein [Nitratireductor sp. OM-1]|uniref:hypothetical protein n=1 Tax=Nitratireductor sp. OM-1 TaxID=1756988 RepID=UPI000DDE2F8C|nr:hypothetical protein [Nitratireductor sp. OM-1]